MTPHDLNWAQEKLLLFAQTYYIIRILYFMTVFINFASGYLNLVSAFHTLKPAVAPHAEYFPVGFSAWMRLFEFNCFAFFNDNHSYSFIRYPYMQDNCYKSFFPHDYQILQIRIFAVSKFERIPRLSFPRCKDWHPCLWVCAEGLLRPACCPCNNL